MKQETKITIKPKEMKDYAHLIKAGIDPFVAQLLYARGITEVETANRYLYGTIDYLNNASLIKNIDTVYNMVSEAIDKQWKVFVFGDYDVDGVTSTAITMLTLRELGADVNYRLPDRLSEGYGMSIKAVEELHEKGCQMIITVDNGIKCHNEIALAKSYGMKVIVLDHHTPSDTLPDADIVIDLHLKGETYPYADLAGCGLAFKVSCYLYEKFGFENEGLKNLDLAAIGTIADVVPLTDENRIIVREGLKLINDKNYDREGIVQLMSIFGIEYGVLKATDIGFKIGPALNAPGRLLPRGAEQSLELLLSSNADDATNLASQLYDTNDTRKQISQESMVKAEEYIAANNLYDDKVMVLLVQDIPEGVVGLVSGKITEKYNRPSLVFSEGHLYYKASARSIEKFNLYEALCTCDDLFVKYGGHSQAAGMTIEKDMKILEELRRRLNEHANSFLTDEDFNKEVYIDDVIPPEEVCFDLIERIEIMEPFGQCNPKPVFYVRDYITVKKPQKGGGGWQPYLYMGENKNHLKLYGEQADAVGFDMVSKYEDIGKPKRLDIVFTLGVNNFRGNEYLQLEMLDFFPAREAKKDNTELMNEMSKAIANLNNYQAVNC